MSLIWVEIEICKEGKLWYLDWKPLVEGYYYDMKGEEHSHCLPFNNPSFQPKATEMMATEWLFKT